MPAFTRTLHRDRSPSTRAHRSRLAVAAAALAVGTALAMTGCSPSGDTGTSTATLRVGITNQTLSFSPTSLDRITASLVYDYLFTQDDKGYHPRAGEFEYNDAHTELTITLIKDVKFADGTALDADLLKKNILWGKDHGAFFSAITSVDVKDDKTVVVHQSRADKNVMLSMWAMPLVDQASLDKPDAVATNPDESGPYLYDKKASTSGSVYAFTKNPKYWNAKAYGYDKVTLTLLADDTSRLNALKSGQIDAAPVATSTADEAKGSGMELTQFYANYAGMILGDRRGEIAKPIADVRVRQAMNMAFDREAMVKSIYGGYAKASSQPFAAGTAGYQKDDADKYAYDPAGAKKLLAEAGYPNGFDLTIPTYQPATRDVEAYIKQALGDIGIRVTYKPQNDDTWLPAFSGGKYAVVPMGIPFAQDVDIAAPDFFWNPWHNDDPKATALLDKINVGSPAEIADATDQLGKLELDDAWFVIWAHPATIWAAKPTVKIGQPQYADWVVISDFSPAK